MFKVCLDDFTGTNIENLALLLEGCGRFLLRSEDTRERFAAMVRHTHSATRISLLTRFNLAVGVDEAQAEYAAYGPQTATALGECLLPGA